MTYNNPEKMPEIAIVGFGAMGKEIQKAAMKEGLPIKAIFDIDKKLADADNFDFDVAIDFSLPGAVTENISILAEHKKNIVVGTTGWLADFEMVKEIIRKANVGMVWGSNFSIGMRMFFLLVKEAARLAGRTEGYDIMVHEMHHRNKQDSPSGTALQLGKIIMDKAGFKKNILADAAHHKIEPSTLHISSTRGGEIPGTHTVIIDSLPDTIELTHRARNRTGFALGALEAAKWIHRRKGIYEFGDVLKTFWER